MFPAPEAVTDEPPGGKYICPCASENSPSPDSQKWSRERGRKELSSCVSMREKSLVVSELILWGRKHSCTLQGPSSHTKNQIDMRQINGRKSNLILTYVQETHIYREIPKAVRQNKVYMSF